MASGIRDTCALVSVHHVFNLRFCNSFFHGRIGTSGCSNPSHQCGAKGILSFENLVACYYNYTLAYDREMSHFIAFATLCMCSWAVLFPGTYQQLQ